MYTNATDILERKFVGKYAEIETADDIKHSGHIYVVDPESKAIVLINHQNRNHLKIITAKSVKSISIDINGDIGEIDVVSQKNSCLDSGDLHRRKEKLKDWLKLNLINVVEDGESLKFENHLIIEPPYDIEHCYCTNTIVLDRFKNIIEKMPMNE